MASPSRARLPSQRSISPSSSLSRSTGSSFDLSLSSDADSLHDEVDADQDVANLREGDQMLPKQEESFDNIPRSSRRSRWWTVIGTGCGLLFIVFVALVFASSALPSIHFGGDEKAQEKESEFTGQAQASISIFPTPASTWSLTSIPLPSIVDQSPPVSTAARRGVILASYKDQNTSWLESLPKHSSGWEVFKYVGDDPNTKYLKTPTNLGREAMAYLTFIIDNYNNLPDYVVFTHGHDKAWHQNEHMLDKLMTLNFSAVKDEQFVNLRCTMSPGCTNDTMFYFDPENPEDTRPGTHIRDGFWESMMKQHFGDLPSIISRRCCAQFATTKEAIRNMPLDFWKEFRRPLEGDLHSVKALWGDAINEYSVGSLFEQVWHIVFGKDPQNCPSADYCRDVYFQGAIHCDGETPKFQKGNDTWKDINCTNIWRVDQHPP